MRSTGKYIHGRVRGRGDKENEEANIKQLGLAHSGPLGGAERMPTAYSGNWLTLCPHGERKREIAVKTDQKKVR